MSESRRHHSGPDRQASPAPTRTDLVPDEPLDSFDVVEASPPPPALVVDEVNQDDLDHIWEQFDQEERVGHAGVKQVAHEPADDEVVTEKDVRVATADHPQDADLILQPVPVVPLPLPGRPAPPRPQRGRRLSTLLQLVLLFTLGVITALAIGFIVNMRRSAQEPAATLAAVQPATVVATSGRAAPRPLAGPTAPATTAAGGRASSRPAESSAAVAVKPTPPRPAARDVAASAPPARVAAPVLPSRVEAPLPTSRVPPSRVPAALPPAVVPARVEPPAPRPAAVAVERPTPSPTIAAAPPSATGTSGVQPAAPTALETFVAFAPAVETPPPPPVYLSATPRATSTVTPQPAAPAPAPANTLNPAAVANPALVNGTAIDVVLNRYERAFNALDAQAAHQIWPSVDTRALEKAFDQLEAQTFDLQGCSIAVTGARAVATCGGTARYVPKVGNRSEHVESRRWTFNLRQAGQSWVIETVNAR